MRGFSEALQADLRGTGVGVMLVSAGKVRSGYWEHNPGSEERVPRVARLMPTLSPEQVANVIVRAVEKDRREVVTPLGLRLLYATHAVLPRFVEWITACSGWQHRSRATVHEGKAKPAWS
jgi:short-subunit dehydrogenase